MSFLFYFENMVRAQITDCALCTPFFSFFKNYFAAAHNLGATGRFVIGLQMTLPMGFKARKDLLLLALFSLACCHPQSHL